MFSGCLIGFELVRTKERLHEFKANRCKAVNAVKIADLISTVGPCPLMRSEKVMV
jgi:hypothetical protein